MSNTPETDELRDDIWQSVYIEGQDFMQMLEHARKLERERDKAREHLKEIGEYGTEEINAAVELRQKLATALVERDRLAEALERLEKTAGLPALHDDPARVQAREALQSLTMKHND